MIYPNRARRAATIIICGWVALRLIQLGSDRPASGPTQIPAVALPVAGLPPPRQTAHAAAGRAAALDQIAPISPVRLWPAGLRHVRRPLLPRSSVVRRSMPQMATEPAANAAMRPLPILVVSDSAARGSPPTTGAALGEPGEAGPPHNPPGMTPPDRRALRPRLALSAWSIIRSTGRARPLATSGALGASQAGIRARYDVLEPAKGAIVAANLRLSTPLQARSGREAGLGISLRPGGKVPIEIIAEARFGLGTGGRDRLAMLVAGGVADQRLPLGLRLSAYGQAGIVGLRHRDAFADGAVTLERPLRQARKLASNPLRARRPGSRAPAVSLGVMIGGGAQPGAGRVDAGPILAITQPLASSGLRLSGGYRWRVAGDARPGSGPALTIGINF